MSVPGKLLYSLWHLPIATVRHSWRHGGPLAQCAAARGESAMRVAAATLPPLPSRSGAPFKVHLLTGHRFVHQTAFCLHSLGRVCTVPIEVEIYDDGSLDDTAASILRRLSASVLIHPHAELAERIDRFLPAASFPVLRERWRNYPHIRKIIDVHLGREGWRLVLDSDLLFWREPHYLIDWSGMPDRSLHAIDCVENYGYTRTLLEKVAGVSIPPRVNVGLCGLRSDAIDWDFIEYAAASLIAAEGTSYYLEQALVAMIVAREGRSAAAPEIDYVTLPSPDEIAQPTAVMHHYVDVSRGLYYRHAWRQTLASL
ncbi:MAG: glycosyl transferase family 2 [Opitutaceae bacterium]|jgi:hypothetical protein